MAEANGAHQIAYGDDVYTAELQRGFAGHFGEGAAGLPGVQRHRRQRHRPAVDAAALGCGDLREHRAHQHRRGRRPRTRRRPQAAAGRDPGRQADPRTDRPGGLGLGRRAPRPAAGRVDHPDHRARHAVHAGRGARHRRPRPRAGHALHMDGARISNAAAALGVPFRRVHHRRRRRHAVASAAPRTASCSARASWC